MFHFPVFVIVVDFITIKSSVNEFPFVLNHVPGTWYLAGYMCDTLADLVNHRRPCVEGPCVTLGPPPADISSIIGRVYQSCVRVSLLLFLCMCRSVAVAHPIASAKLKYDAFVELGRCVGGTNIRDEVCVCACESFRFCKNRRLCCCTARPCVFVRRRRCVCVRTLYVFFC